MENKGYYDKDLMQRLKLEFDAECRKLGYNPNTKIFGFMYNNNLTEIEYKEKLTSRYNKWVHNLRNMPADVKMQKINEAQRELEQIYNSMAAKVNYLYKQEKLDFLTTFKDKIKDAIHIGKLETFATWANIKALQAIFGEMVSLKLVAAKDENNFYKVFGVWNNSAPFAKVEWLGNATNLTAFLLLMRKEKSEKFLTDKQKAIANNLFSVDLKIGTNIKRDDSQKWSEKMKITTNHRTPKLIIPQDAGGLTY